eukprot:9898496-Alexandrium_andersonii.AAC.1
MVHLKLNTPYCNPLELELCTQFVRWVAPGSAGFCGVPPGPARAETPSLCSVGANLVRRVPLGSAGSL